MLELTSLGTWATICAWLAERQRDGILWIICTQSKWGACGTGEDNLVTWEELRIHGGQGRRGLLLTMEYLRYDQDYSFDRQS
jgi:hypothetical protein